MNFNDLFSMLIDMTDSSIADVARNIAYDRSYVSKWYNHKIFPSIEAWDEISPQLADYFSEKMQPEHFMKIAAKSPRIKVERDSVSKNRLLKSLLDDAFNTSYLEAYPRENIFASSNISSMLNGPEELISFMFDVIDKGTTNENITKDIYFQGDVLDALTPEMIDVLEFPYTSNNDYRFHFVTNSHFYNYRDESVRKVHKFFRLTSQLSFLELIPYINDGVQDFQCAFDEFYYTYGTPVSSGKDFKIFITQNTDVFEKGKRKLKKNFAQLSPLIEAEPSLENFTGWLKQNPAGNRALLYMPALSIYLAGQTLSEKLLANKIISQSDYDIWQVLSALLQAANQQNVVFIIPESGIKRVMQEGLVKTCEGLIRLTGEYKSAYIAEMQALLDEKKAKDELCIIPGGVPNAGRLPLNAIYSDGKTSLYLQTNQINAYGSGRFFYKIKDIALSDIVHRYLSELRFIEKNNFSL
ncbi:MAG: hypothetical protein ACOX3H_00285 [Saccharofermentanales bacterium]|jgi:hypothetical protein